MPVKDRDAYNEYMRSYMLRKYHERRAEAIGILGGCCIQCGRTDDLEVDHMDWRDKSFPIAKLWSVAQRRFLQELAKCQLLCREHHREKTRKDMVEIKRERGGANQYARYGPR